MAGELIATYGVVGRTRMKATVFNAASQVYRSDTQVFEAYNPANLALYRLALTEQGSSGRYVGDLPTLPAGTYYWVARDQAAASPSEDPAVDLYVYEGRIEWDGTAVVPLSSRLAPFVAGRTIAVDVNHRVDVGEVIGNPPSSTADDDIAFLRKVFDGDEYIDATTNPWTVVVKEKGTNNVLIRKILRDINGNGITSTNVVIASQKET